MADRELRPRSHASWHKQQSKQSEPTHRNGPSWLVPSGQRDVIHFLDRDRPQVRGIAPQVSVGNMRLETPRRKFRCGKTYPIPPNSPRAFLSISTIMRRFHDQWELWVANLFSFSTIMALVSPSFVTQMTFARPRMKFVPCPNAPNLRVCDYGGIPQGLYLVSRHLSRDRNQPKSPYSVAGHKLICENLLVNHHRLGALAIADCARLSPLFVVSQADSPPFASGTCS